MSLLYAKLLTVQSKLKVAKENMNNFGGYKYRSCEDILEGVKPLLLEVNSIVTLSDTIELVSDRFYVKATATFIDIEDGSKHEVSAYAREDLNKKGMDLAQVTGSVSSYARKYALNGLFCIDDTKDSDATNKHGLDDIAADNNKKSSQSFNLHICNDCKSEITATTKSTINEIVEKSLKYEKCKLCAKCINIRYESKKTKTS